MLKRALIKLVKFYQKHISSNTSPSCRYYPTCSNYAITAIDRYGVLKGGFMALFRILRCNPLFKGGLDLVPEKKKRKKDR